MISKITILITLIFINFSLLHAQLEEEPADSSVFFNSKNISLLTVSALCAGSLFDSYMIWWRDDRRSFSVMHSGWYDENSEFGIDKLGHFYTSYFLFKFQKNIFVLGGHSDESADILSGSLTLGMALIIEIGDGYSKYGFDSKDLISNIAGLGYAFIQEKIPVLNNFNFKWSYFPPEGFNFPPRFSDHYDGHIYWLTINAAGLFPATVGKVLPTFIHPAIGYSVGNLATRREFMVGLDLDIYSLMKSDNKYVDFTGKTLNLFHVPMPGIKMYENRSPEYKLFLLN